MGLICHVEQEVIYKVIKKQSGGSVCVYSYISHLTPNILLASTALLAAVLHGHLSLLLLDQVISGVAALIACHCFPMVFHAMRIRG